MRIFFLGVMLLQVSLFYAAAHNKVKTLRDQGIKYIAERPELDRADILPVCLVTDINKFRASIELKKLIDVMQARRTDAEKHSMTGRLFKLFVKGASFRLADARPTSSEVYIVLYQLIQSRRLDFYQKFNILNECMTIEKALSGLAGSRILAHATIKDPQLVSALMYYGADATQLVSCIMGHAGQAPIHIAARLGLADVVRTYLAYHVDPNIQNMSGWTPLHHACVFKHFEVARVLMEFGAMPEAVGRLGTTPLSLVEGHSEMLAILRQSRTDHTQHHNKKQRRR